MRKTIVLLALCLFVSTVALAHEGHKHNLLGTVKSLKENKLDADKAFDRGQSDRRAGKTRSQNPYIYRSGKEADVLVEEWERGWDRQNAEIRGIAHAD